MNSQCRLEPLGTYGVPPKRYKISKGRKLSFKEFEWFEEYRPEIKVIDNDRGYYLPSHYGEHQPMMYLTTTNSEGKKKTSFVEQRIELTTAINKGNVYPYNSTKRNKLGTA